MPLLVASLLYGGIFFGYSAVDAGIIAKIKPDSFPTSEQLAEESKRDIEEMLTKGGFSHEE